MSYLLIKEDDAKIFKSFMSGNEIEVGVYVNPANETFGAGNQIEIFYGSDYTDTYTAEIKKHTVPSAYSGKALVKLSLVKV